jgi:hypothetical protein
MSSLHETDEVHHDMTTYSGLNVTPVKSLASILDTSGVGTSPSWAGFIVGGEGERFTSDVGVAVLEALAPAAKVADIEGMSSTW